MTAQQTEPRPSPAQIAKLASIRAHVIECRSIAVRYPSNETRDMVARAELRYASERANLYPRRNCHTVYQVGPQPFTH